MQLSHPIYCLGFLVVFNCLCLTQCPTSFSSINHLHLLAWFLILFQPTLDEDLLINPSANMFLFGEFNIHHKDWLTYSGGTDRPSEPCYSFPISNTLLRWLMFLLTSLAVILTVLLFWISFF